MAVQDSCKGKVALLIRHYCKLTIIHQKRLYFDLRVFGLKRDYSTQRTAIVLCAVASYLLLLFNSKSVTVIQAARCTMVNDEDETIRVG